MQSAQSTRFRTGGHEAEEAPLLCNAAGTGGEGYSSVNASEDARKSVTPLPKGQVALLSYMRLATPLVDSQALPYINEMMLRIGVAKNPAQVGYYSGIVQSTYAFVQAATVLKTGMFADQFGRKPVIIVGQIGIIIFVVAFGLSRSFAWALITRALAGALAGNGMLINNVVADITDDTNQAQAYAAIGLSLNVASVLGPFIGGTFADPQVTFPDSFGRVQFLRDFPYFLPCVISGLIVLGSLILSIRFFKETAEFKTRRQRTESGTTEAATKSSIPSEPKASAWQLATEPTLFSVLCNFFMLNLINTSGNVVFVLFAYTSIESGGLSRSPAEIGFIISSTGIIAALIELFAIGFLQRRIGTVKFIRWTMGVWPLIFCMYPFLNAFARLLAIDTSQVGNGNSQDIPTVNALFWVVVTGHLTLQRVASMAYPLGLILTKNAAPSKNVLGTVFGLGQLVACAGKTIAVAFSSSLFAYSKERDVLGGNLVWVIMTVISLLGLWSAMVVRDGSSR